ncbi:hypothetical protein U9M73_08185 [Paenibacillus phoenicis]|uniref:Uncharacterized protein n=1 Tax=Paenibacillus phoenicis TaxID=554117 RepID=A0ABU5PJ64_9BACL|nr:MULTISPECIES: hypothetical protein [Paenibacillus]EES72243.1 hypothetical protein POTG_03083 [Paenibacillus sp. oral taxon 786 str. D14]MCT2195217.1 hypothetical protein [Paenibacillus sp. p3-SID1389]MEA3569979.1 hypothetical protein [Paenibacillus phoenicis]
MTNDLEPAAYRELLEGTDLEEDKRQALLELIQRYEQLRAENVRLRKALLRANSQQSSRMSTKLKEALYE